MFFCTANKSYKIVAKLFSTHYLHSIYYEWKKCTFVNKKINKNLNSEFSSTKKNKTRQKQNLKKEKSKYNRI